MHPLAGTIYAAGITATSGLPLRNIALGLIGTLAMVVLAGRALSAWLDERYGKLLSAIVAAVLVVGFCYFPDQTIDILKGLWGQGTGA